MDWFERITGFPETDHAGTQARLRVEGQDLVHRQSGRRFSMGRLELVTLAELRQRVGPLTPGTALPVDTVRGDVRRLHLAPQHAGALFQVASQFNLLEMVSPQISPEDGITRYRHDATQGPACAMAAGAATVYRQYLLPLGHGRGQTRERQVDTLAYLGAALGHPRLSLWDWRNGYALCHARGLAHIQQTLEAADEDRRDQLRGLLQIGLHWDVEVTDAIDGPGPLVSQAFCSALPVAYGTPPRAAWAPFARLVLEAAYEATLLAAVLNARRGASRQVLLTRLGGGAFGNDAAWIHLARQRALALVAGQDLEVIDVIR